MLEQNSHDGIASFNHTSTFCESGILLEVKDIGLNESYYLPLKCLDPSGKTCLYINNNKQNGENGEERNEIITWQIFIIIQDKSLNGILVLIFIITEPIFD